MKFIMYCLPFLLACTGCGSSNDSTPIKMSAGSNVSSEANAANSPDVQSANAPATQDSVAFAPGSSGAASGLPPISPSQTTASTQDKTPAVTNSKASNPKTAPKVAPPQPTPQQLAAWGIPESESIKLLACYDGFGDGLVQQMAISPDGKTLAVAGVRLTLWNPTQSTPQHDLLQGMTEKEVERPLRSVGISPDGKWIAAGDHKGRLLLWSLADRSLVKSISAHDARLTQLAFSPDSQSIATTSYSGEVRIWNIPSCEKKKTFKASDGEVHGLEFLSDNLLVTNGTEANLWNLGTDTKEKVLSSAYVRGPSLAMSADRKVIAFGDSDPVIRLWDVEAQTVIGRLSIPAELVRFSQDGRRIATYASDRLIRIWDSASRQIVQVLDADGGRVAALGWLPESNLLVVASEAGRIRIWGTDANAQVAGIQPMNLPSVDLPAADAKDVLTSLQLQRVIDLRSFPRLPDSEPQWQASSNVSYQSKVKAEEADLFYRYNLGKAGWTEFEGGDARSRSYSKNGCQLSVGIFPAGSELSKDSGVIVSLSLSDSFPLTRLPRIANRNTKGGWDTPASFGYQIMDAKLTETEVEFLKSFHAAGWTPFSRLNASFTEDPKTRTFTMLQRGSLLHLSITPPVDVKDHLLVQLSKELSNKTLPIPPDAGWVEFDHSTDMHLVANTHGTLEETVKFYDQQMLAEGWIAREAGRQIKEDKAWLPYIRGQQDVLVRLVPLPDFGTRILVGEPEKSSWQLKKPVAVDPDQKKLGIEAADFAIPQGATKVQYNLDEKKIEFESKALKPQVVAEKFSEYLESLNWKKEGTGVVSDEYMFLTYSKGKEEIQLRARLAADGSTTMISGDGLYWNKPLPTAPVRASYGTWLLRNLRIASLDWLDEFANEMMAIEDR